jgi:hypothetical protein
MFIFSPSFCLIIQHSVATNLQKTVNLFDRVQFMNWIADQVHHLKETNKTFTILSVPRTTVLCEALIDQEKLRDGSFFDFLHKKSCPTNNVFAFFALY